jgi:putative hydrolase of the HAD superfamily
MLIEAVIWDFGGVLTTSPFEAFARESLALGAEVRGKDVLPLLSGDLRPEMVDALRHVKARFKTGCITNNLPANAIGSASGRSLYVAEVMALFEHVIESAKIGLRKPDPRIYQMMVEALRVDPRNCVYLGDLGVNLKPARDMGMTTIKVLNAPQAIAELKAATGLSLRETPAINS